MPAEMIAKQDCYFQQKKMCGVHAQRAGNKGHAAKGQVPRARVTAGEGPGSELSRGGEMDAVGWGVRESQI